ncbi:MAG: DNA polymerase III subunit delta' [Acidobacteriota bacterium]|nr:DNA polymerase III subunit delta' [Blastocatellia bacterium]MDW8411598.1 DNA polymerase III subunit delta' [Acidobacteriota bacterium]
MSFNTLIGNLRIKTWLSRVIADDRLPASLIFYGQQGVGKRSFALAFAQAVNCMATERPCGGCHVCKRIQQLAHPDVLEVIPEGQFIKIEQVRKLIEEAYYAPFEGRKRIFIINSAERLKEQAANALLKTLEEPPSTSVIVLLTTSIDALLPTIKSRSVKLNFSPVEEGELLQYVASKCGKSGLELLLLTRLCAGSPGKALEIDLSTYKQRRQELVAVLEALTRRDLISIVRSAELLGKREREEFIAYLEILRCLLRDMILLKAGISDTMVNVDLERTLSQFAAAFLQKSLEGFFHQVCVIESDLQRNINRQLVLEKTFLSVIDACRKSV